MSSHRIALRRAWEALPDRRDAEAPRRLDLPTDLDPEWHILTLMRRFHQPEIDPLAERIHLELSRVDGLIQASVDAIPLALPRPRVDHLRIELPPPREPGARRRSLILVVDVAAARERDDWGHVALVIAPLGQD